MSTLAFLTQLVGGQILGDHLTAHVNLLVAQDGFSPDAGYRYVTDRADAGDPSILAAAGQTWVLRPDVDPDEAPAKRLIIVERTAKGIFVVYCDITHEAGEAPADLQPQDVGLGDAADGDDLLISVLDLYELESWYPPEYLLPGCQPKGVDVP